ncbi:ubiquitin-conjugating enzyme/RWD-like protein [Cladochytrium replicatum]|nr:ubiquitin-conjugating enzyme/RWD-like protein [Cladochytrium replicatum]
MSNRTLLRIQKELIDIQRNPDNTTFTLHYDDANIKHVHAILVGPPQTPYSFGLFDFVINFDNDYPAGPPKVSAMTTSNGTIRFNPNIYASGKVCLSILGTWRGEPGEEWSSAHGISSVLISIQSLMSDKPYQNEPGFETERDPGVLEPYNQKIMHETLRVSICDRLEHILGLRPNEIKLDSGTSISRNFCTCRERSPFEDLAKRLFLLYFDNYMEVVAAETDKVKEGFPFTRTRFEGSGNMMDGSFHYGSIKLRLEKIYKLLEEETQTWLVESKENIKNDTTTASNLKSQYAQIKASGDYDSLMIVELQDDNPFEWNVTVLGSPATQYEGGMFTAKMIFHNNFPGVQPRVRFSTDVFHPQITRDGVPYYSTKRPEDVRQHLSAIAALFTQDPDSSPMTHVNLRAATLYFGDREQRRDFNRNARRCAQRSVES